MADYFTQFSCLLDVRTPENATRAMELYNSLSEDETLENPPGGSFQLTVLPEPDDRLLWITDDMTGNPEGVIQFVKLCAAEFGLTGRWGFQYANSCSKPRLDGFGGGAHVLNLGTGKSLGWICTDVWLANVLDGGSSNA